MTQVITATTTDAVLIKGFFSPTEKASQFIPEYKALTAADKAQLAAGIRDGSLTY